GESEHPESDADDMPEERRPYETCDEEAIDAASAEAEEPPPEEEDVEPTPKRIKVKVEQNSAACAAARAVLQQEVPEVMQDFAGPQEKWSVGELNKRVLKYFTNGLSAAVEGNHSAWRALAQKFLEKSLRSFACACGSRVWFMEAEERLKPVLSRTAWELVQDCEDADSSTPSLVELLVDTAYAELSDQHCFEVSVRDAVQKSYGEHGQAVVSKMIQALHRSYPGAVKEGETAEGFRNEKIEAFAHSWINKSMDRAYMMLGKEKHDLLLTESAMVDLFKWLMSPEKTETFSCIPRELLGNTPRPSWNWKFIRPTVCKLLERWAEDSGTSRVQRKRPMPLVLRNSM
ncbi:unnamed protein product, partial [Effrenium voratum]